MAKETLEEFIERRAQKNVQDLVDEGVLDPNDQKRMDGALKMARIIAKGSEAEKIKRKFTLGTPDHPSAEKPFVGCNAICSINGMFPGSIEGPNDFCKTIKDTTGTLYFCTHPSVKPLPNGSRPLCFNYLQSYGNATGIERVSRGEVVFKK